MTEYGCSNHYCYLLGKRKGMGTNAGCSCLMQLPTGLRLAIERRIQSLESDTRKMDWIKVEDELPEIGQRVIYFFEYTGISIGKFEKEEKDVKYGNIFYGKQGFLTDDVTHWMPLPEKPSDLDKYVKGESWE